MVAMLYVIGTAVMLILALACVCGVFYMRDKKAPWRRWQEHLHEEDMRHAAVVFSVVAGAFAIGMAVVLAAPSKNGGVVVVGMGELTRQVAGIRQLLSSNPPAEFISPVHSLGWAWVPLLLILGLGLLMASSGSRAVRVSGGVIFSLSSLLAGAHLADKASIDNLVHIERVLIEPDKVTEATADSVAWRSSVSCIAVVDSFPPGMASPAPRDTAIADTKLTDVLKEWASLVGSGGSGHVLIVGSADRVRMRSATRAWRGDNPGLAQARAEWACERLLTLAARRNISVRPLQGDILLSLKGPSVTSERRNPLSGSPSDRGVMVYLVSLRRSSLGGFSVHPRKHWRFPATQTAIVGAMMFLVGKIIGDLRSGPILEGLGLPSVGKFVEQRKIIGDLRPGPILKGLGLLSVTFALVFSPRSIAGVLVAGMTAAALGLIPGDKARDPER